VGDLGRIDVPTGTVKWFNNAKGYGFILPEDGGEDLFVHYSSIRMDGYKTLKAGQAVQFETHATDKGFHAIEVETDGPAGEQAAGDTPAGDDTGAAGRDDAPGHALG
jgi:CspA family cold shock protein